MSKQLLFVCTGNTCRSPMAEILLKASLPSEAGWTVASAGVSATPGTRASESARAAIAECGLSLENHRSQLVTPELVSRSAVIVAMTQRHMEKVLQCVPSARDRIYLLSSFDPKAPKGADVMDPFCGSLEDYRACRDTLQQAMPGLVRFLASE
jgi:protein-tyrosine-phosphatase